MSISITLYRAIKNLCPTNFKGSFSTLKENSEKSYGLYYRGGAPSDRNLQTGEYLSRSSPITININGGKDVNGSIDAYQFCEDARHAIETTFNHPFTDLTTGESVFIVSTETIGDIRSLGFNGYDIPSFSMNFIIKYSGGS